MLSEQGELSFSMIKDKLNETTRHGVTSNRLGNILAKDPRFLKSGHERKLSIISGNYRITLWKLKEEN
jgi:hypothetical protein